MQNHILDDYLDDLKRQLRHLPLAEQRSVLDDVRSHLEADVTERRRRDKALSMDEAVLAATHAFGDPADIGVSHGAGGGVVRKSTGEVLLHVAVLTGRGVARTVGKTVKWTGLAVGALLLVAVAVGLTLALVYKDTITQSVQQEESRRSVYAYSGAWASPNVQNGPHSDSFQVPEHSRGQLTISVSQMTGCVAIQVTGPNGQVAYSNDQGCSSASKVLSFTEAGTWTVQFTYVAFTGSVSAYAYVENAPPNPN